MKENFMKKEPMEKELHEALRRLDAEVCTQKAEKKTDDVVIRIRTADGTFSWAVEENDCKKKLPAKRGKGIASLQTAISAAEKKASSRRESFLVLCRLSEEKSKNSIITSWAVCDPIADMNLSDGRMPFTVKKTETSEADAAYFRETGLALESENGEILPLLRSAVYSAGKVFTLGSALRDLEKPQLMPPFAEAMLLCRRLPESEYTLILKKGETCSPIIGFGGGRYAAVSQESLIREALAFLRRSYVCDIAEWRADIDETYVRIEAADMNGQYYFIVRDSVSPMRSISVTAGIRIGESDVEIKTASAHHWKAFSEKGGIEALISTLPEELEKAQKMIRKLEGAVHLQAGDLDPILNLIGKNRAEAAHLPKPGTYSSGSDLFAAITAAVRQQKLKSYQKERLPRVYEALVRSLAENGKGAD